MDAVAFYLVAEDLVECSSVQASRNMQIDPSDQPAVLNTAIGKKRMFHIGMSTGLSSPYAIKYVIRKSFANDTIEQAHVLPSTQVSKNTNTSNLCLLILCHMLLT
jgi:replication factor A1